MALVNDKTLSFDNLRPQEKEAILAANHGPSIYDKFYSQDGVTSEHSYETLISLIAGEESRINGVLKPTKGRKKHDNPYKKTFVNGVKRRTVLGETGSSLSESETSIIAPSTTAAGTIKPKKKSANASQSKSLSSYLFETDSSMDAIIMSNVTSVRKKSPKRKGPPKTSGLKQMEKALQQSSATDSDDLELPGLKVQRGGMSKRDRALIYSDSDSETASRKMANVINSVATKGALKEFSKKKLKETPIKKSPLKKIKRIGAGRKKKNGDYDPSELIVPQREAAKKASESIRAVKGVKAKESGTEMGSPGVIFKEKDVLPVRETITTKGKQSKRRESVSDSERPAVKKERNLGKKLKEKLDDPASPSSPSEIKDEFDFDDANAESSSVSYVPQRQAAKKAAEHIRSGLSNIVAARLIIEDEMEAARKKTKLEKSGKHSKGHDDTEDEKSNRLRRKSASPRRLVDGLNDDLQDGLSKVAKMKELKGLYSCKVGCLRVLLVW